MEEKFKQMMTNVTAETKILRWVKVYLNLLFHKSLEIKTLLFLFNFNQDEDKIVILSLSKSKFMTFNKLCIYLIYINK